MGLWVVGAAAAAEGGSPFSHPAAIADSRNRIIKDINKKEAPPNQYRKLTANEEA